MAGTGRGGQGGADAEPGISERLLFAPETASNGTATALSDLPQGDAASPLDDLIAARRRIRSSAEVISSNDISWLQNHWQNLRKQLGRNPRVLLAAAVAMELDRGVAFLFAPVFLAAGAVVYFSLANEPAFLQPLISCWVLAVIVFFTRSRRAAHLVAAALFFFALGILAGKVETWRMPGDLLGAQVSTRVTGRVISVETMASGRTRLTLDVIATERPKLRYQPGRVRLSALAMSADIRVGTVVSGYARLMPPAGPVRPGGYDFSFESYFDGIGATGFFMGKPKLVATEHEMEATTSLLVAVETARQAIADRIRASIGGPEGEIAAALIVGVRAGIPESVNEAMRRTGIYHIISISGLHMVMVAGTVMLLLRGGFALFPNFSARQPVKKYAAFAALCSIAAYLAISGMVVAAERSFIMLAVMLIAVLFDRAALSMRNLAISAVIVILIAPHEVVGPSFQMSFAATAALIGAYAAWSERRGLAPATPPPTRSFIGLLVHKSLVAVAMLAATSIIAGLATALYSVWHFQRVSPLSLLANLAVMPVVSLIVMPAAVLSALLMPFGVDWVFLYAMGKGLTAMMAIAEWISARSPVDGVGLVSTQSVVLVSAALAIGAMATTWLRLFALPFALAALLTMGDVDTPDVLISEDARLVALPLGDGELAVSRARPNVFMLDNWRRALDAEIVVLPEEMTTESAIPIENALDLPPGTSFLCRGGLCFARHSSGAVIATATKAGVARAACAIAVVIVINDATAADPCNEPAVVVITKQDLALLGSAAIRFDAPSDKPANVLFALDHSDRPWHAQRIFTREARGLPPREEKISKFKGQAN